MAKKMRRKTDGFWIPKVIWFYTGITLLEKMIWIEVNSLDASEKGCYASNKHFAKLFGLKKKYISQIINNMVKKGMLKSNATKGIRGLRYLKPVSFWSGGGIPPQQEGYPATAGGVIPPQQEQSSNNPNTNNNKEQLETTVDFSSEQILDLDLEIGKKSRLFMSEINRLLKPLPRSAKTFASITKYLVEECQESRLTPSVFSDAIEWASKAANSRTATNPCGLFVAVVKRETGFKKQELL